MQRCETESSLVAWAFLTRGDLPHAAPAATVPRLPWRSRTAWLLVAIFALVAMMLGLGYTIAAASPFLLGAIRDATGSFDAVLWAAAGFLMAQFFALFALVRVRGSR